MGGVEEKVVHDDALRGRLLAFQRTELTEAALYEALARRVGGENGEVLKRVAADERRHGAIWQGYTGTEVRPQMWRVRLYLLLARLFGFTFAIKLLEKREDRAQGGYESLVDVFPETREIIADETRHEESLIGLLDEERLRYMSSMILGLNDALVELTGALAGLSLALADSATVALAGLITGIAAALSMSASEYLSQKSEGGDGHPLKAALYTGAAYLATVAVLILPFFVFHHPLLALAFTLAGGVAVIVIFTFFMAVVRDISFRRNFAEMVSISLGVAAVSFLIGLAARRFLGADV
ncbi:MAG: VIT1/CCC1 transporter family protein [Synergistaceae bacterium]|nr:VIT1/CCC1 transporter family protein [Synergistaceae bacterium]